MSVFLRRREIIMPMLSFKGVKLEEIKDMSTQLVDTLAKIANAPREYFTLEFKETTFISDGALRTTYPIIEIKWFDRGQTVKDQMAKVIDQALREKGYDHIEIIFYPLIKSDYYENGEIFK
jgi:hypothetical protein